MSKSLLSNNLRRKSLFLEDSAADSSVLIGSTSIAVSGGSGGLSVSSGLPESRLSLDRAAAGCGGRSSSFPSGGVWMPESSEPVGTSGGSASLGAGTSMGNRSGTPSGEVGVMSSGILWRTESRDRFLWWPHPAGGPLAPVTCLRTNKHHKLNLGTFPRGNRDSVNPTAEQNYVLVERVFIVLNTDDDYFPNNHLSGRLKIAQKLNNRAEH